jgi:PAS domain S-box-containing protein
MTLRQKTLILIGVTLADFSLLLYAHGRLVMWQARATSFYLLVSLLAFGLGLGVGTLFFLQKVMLARLQSLDQSVNRIATSGDLSERVPVPGTDELSGLAVAINRILKVAQDQKRESEERFCIMADNAPVMLWVTNADAALTFVNKPWLDFIGQAPAQEIGEIWAECIHPEDLRHFVETFQSAFHSRQNFKREYRLKRADGKYRWILDTGAPQFAHDGTFAGYIGSAIDITERKRAEEALRQSETRIRSLVENATYGIYLCSVEGKLLDVNPALVALLGYQSETELLAANLATDIFRSPDEAAQLVAQCEQAGRLESVDVDWKHRDGKPITVRLSGRAVRDDRGVLAYFEIFAENVTERRALEEQLRQSQKMEAVGRLAGGVAHDFNNLMNVVMGYAELVLDGLAPADSLRGKVEEIKKAGQRATSLTRQLLAFSRKQVLEPKLINLNSVVEEMDKMLKRLIGEDIDLVTVLGPALGQVRADPSQIEQVIMNLTVNSRDALPNGGKLIIETANVYLDEAEARRHPGARPGPYVMLSVSDTGCGMDAETRSHIFEPFFTTKAKGKGTGLGLATVYGIVSQSGGHIRVESESGRGTSFMIYLPRVEQEFEAIEPGKAPTVSLQGSETLLIVEDEEPVRALVCEILQKNGYTVLEAGHGAEAIQICERHEGSIQLMVTDVVMPGMSGRELAQRLSTLRPDMKVLYVSGYTEDAIVHYGVLDQGTNFLQKPFRPYDLARKVREVLDMDKATSAPVVGRENK